MEKYRDLVLTLIKNHRKFKNCESIIDDIYNEVSNRASAIIEGIEDENIIRNYLIKAVSSAMITVPKKLGIETRTERPSAIHISEQTEESEIITPQNIESQHTEYTPEEELTIQKEEYPQQSESATESEAAEIIDTEDNDTLLEEIAEEAPAETDSAQNDTYDKTLVDKMINGSEYTTETAEISELDLEDTDSITIEDENTDTLEEFEELKIDEDVENLAAEDSFELNNDAAEEKLFSEPVNNLFDEENNDTVTLEDAFPETAQETLNTEEDSLTESPVFDEEYISEEETNINDIDEVEQGEADDFKLPDLSCFKIENAEVFINDEMFMEKLNNTEKTFPEMQIKEVLILKFCKNKSVAEIAKALNISEENVIGALNEAADIIEE